MFQGIDCISEQRLRRQLAVTQFDHWPWPEWAETARPEFDSEHAVAALQSTAETVGLDADQARLPWLQYQVNVWVGQGLAPLRRVAAQIPAYDPEVLDQVGQFGAGADARVVKVAGPGGVAQHAARFARVAPVLSRFSYRRHCVAD